MCVCVVCVYERDRVCSCVFVKNKMSALREGEEATAWIDGLKDE